MLARYPGLVGNFKRGYKELFFDRDLFEVVNKDIATLPFMDRLNIKSKGRDLVEVPVCRSTKFLTSIKRWP